MALAPLRIRAENETVGTGTYLGMSYLAWAMICWTMLAGTFFVILLYRVLISYKAEDEFFMSPAEARETFHHLKHVDRMAVWFGIASAVSLAGIVATWVTVGF